MTNNKIALLSLAVLSLSSNLGNAFVTPSSSSAQRTAAAPATSTSSLKASTLDPVTYLRTEWVSAALVTNQTPRSADKVLQLGAQDGRIVNFVPRTVREIITSACSTDGLDVSTERQLNQQVSRRNSGVDIKFSNQRADDLTDIPSSTIDVVVSMQSAAKMAENGLDWKKSVREAGRVLKPGGRFLFVESVEVGNESYLDYVVGLSEFSSENKSGGAEGVISAMDNAEEEGEDGEEEEEDAKSPIFEEVGYDQVDMVLMPHIAGVAIKAEDADLSKAQKIEKKQQEESDRLAEISLNAFERGSKKRRRKKKKSKGMGMDDDM